MKIRKFLKLLRILIVVVLLSGCAFGAAPAIGGAVGTGAGLAAAATVAKITFELIVVTVPVWAPVLFSAADAATDSSARPLEMASIIGAEVLAPPVVMADEVLGKIFVIARAPVRASLKLERCLVNYEIRALPPGTDPAKDWKEWTTILLVQSFLPPKLCPDKLEKSVIEKIIEWVKSNPSMSQAAREILDDFKTTPWD